MVVVGSHGAGDVGVVVARVHIGDRDGGIVDAGDGNGERRTGRRAVLVGDGVAGDDVGRGALGEMLIGGIAGVEAVAAVAVQRQTRNRRIERIGQDRAVIDVAVVVRDRAGDGGVLETGVHIGHRDGGVVDAGDGNGERRTGRGAVLVGDGVAGDDVGRGALGEMLIGGIAGIEAVAAVAVQRQTRN